MEWRTDTQTDFAIILFVGVMIHGLFSECLNRFPGLVLSNANYIKKVVFPLVHQTDASEDFKGR